MSGSYKGLYWTAKGEMTPQYDKETVLSLCIHFFEVQFLYLKKEKIYIYDYIKL